MEDTKLATVLKDQELAEIVSRLIAAYRPERIYLFGSHAKRSATDESDLDLLIVEREPFGAERSRWRELSRIRRALSSFRVAKDLLVFSADEVEYWKDSPNHVIGECLAEGRLLYARS